MTLEPASLFALIINGILRIIVAEWSIEFFEDDRGCPVRAFLDALEARKRAKVLALIRLLEEQGATLPFPYSSQIQGKLRELRTHYGEEHYRVLYFGAPDRTFVLLHGVVKRSPKLPTGDIRIARERMQRSTEMKRSRRQR